MKTGTHTTHSNRHAALSPRRARRAWACAWGCATVAALLALLQGCGGAKPPVHVTEVPIDQFQTDRAPLTADSGAPATPAPEAPAADATSASPTTGDRPSPIATNAGAGAGKPPVPAGQRPTAAECGKLTDRYVVLLGVSQGMTTGAATRGLAKLRAAAQSDATYAAAQAACPEQTTKKQYQCAVRASSVNAWKACVE